MPIESRYFLRSTYRLFRKLNYKYTVDLLYVNLREASGLYNGSTLFSLPAVISRLRSRNSRSNKWIQLVQLVNESSFNRTITKISSK